MPTYCTEPAKGEGHENGKDFKGKVERLAAHVAPIVGLEIIPAGSKDEDSKRGAGPSAQVCILVFLLV